MESINESLARAAKYANSYNDYKEGSATVAYNAQCDEIKAIAAKRKEHIPAERWAELDGLVARYCSKLASWINRDNACRASCPSILISGGGNFPVRKKERQIAREETLMREYVKEIAALKEKIQTFGVFGFPILSDDENAVEKLEAKIAAAEEKQRAMKECNAYYRKHKTLKGCDGVSDETAARLDKEIPTRYAWERCPYSSYLLTNNNANIKRMHERLENIKREKESEGREYDTGDLPLTVKENKDTMRLQVIFNEKPSPQVRDIMKAAAFKWAPSQNAWQRQLTDNARHALRRVLERLRREVSA